MCIRDRCDTANHTFVEDCLDIDLVTLFDKFLRYKLCDCADNSTCYEAQYRPPEMSIRVSVAQRVVCAVGVAVQA